MCFLVKSYCYVISLYLGAILAYVWGVRGKPCGGEVRLECVLRLLLALVLALRLRLCGLCAVAVGGRLLIRCVLVLIMHVWVLVLICSCLVAVLGALVAIKVVLIFLIMLISFIYIT